MQQATEKIIKYQIYESGVTIDNSQIYTHNIERLLVYGDSLGISLNVPDYIREKTAIESGGDLVLRVPRRPGVVDGLHIAVLQAFQRAAGVLRHAAYVAGLAVQRLTTRHLADDIVHALLEPLITRGGVFERDRAQVMPQRVAGEVAALPPVVNRRFRRRKPALSASRRRIRTCAPSGGRD